MTAGYSRRVRYEPMELTGANLVGMYEIEEAALRDVAETLRLYGPDAVATLALGRNDPEGDGAVIAAGPALAALAREAAARPADGAGRPRARARTGR
jgi:hypothetical protein